MCLNRRSVLLHMRHILTLSAALLAAASFAGSTAHATDLSIPAYSRDANGIALAVTEMLPALDDCVASHQALGGSGSVELKIAFAVDTHGEIANLSVDGAPVTTTLPSCIEGTLSAMHFQQGERSVQVKLPLIAAAKTESVIR